MKIDEIKCEHCWVELFECDIVDQEKKTHRWRELCLGKDIIKNISMSEVFSN